MNTRSRSEKGRQPKSDKIEIPKGVLIEECEIVSYQPQIIWKIAKIVILILILSPWIYLIFRKRKLEDLTNGISDFYQENFSGKCECKCIDPHLDEIAKSNGKTKQKEEIKNGF